MAAVRPRPSRTRQSPVEAFPARAVVLSSCRIRLCWSSQAVARSPRCCQKSLAAPAAAHPASLTDPPPSARSFPDPPADAIKSLFPLPLSSLRNLHAPIDSSFSSLKPPRRLSPAFCGAPGRGRTTPRVVGRLYSLAVRRFGGAQTERGFLLGLPLRAGRGFYFLFRVPASEGAYMPYYLLVQSILPNLIVQHPPTLPHPTRFVCTAPYSTRPAARP